MSEVYSPKSNAPDLPDDVVLRVSGVSKKFCRNLRRSMWYGIQDLSRNLVGKTLDHRHWTLDQEGKGKTLDIRPETLDRGENRTIEDPESLESKVHSLKSEPEGGLRRDEFWALRDISFELRRGECLGLIGRNGCGKTTLLRLIAGIFPPDGGEIAIRGRVGALIALGAGFHPHMTGRENVYLNGAILGLSRKEIDAQFDEIVDFAEIGEFIDAPVSTYSSGMRVRLGFAVATAIKPDLLLVDEILAVGDVQFRAKCYNTIFELAKESSVVLVSHNLTQVRRVCTRVIAMEQGQLVVDAGQGAMDAALDGYVETNSVAVASSNDLAGAELRDIQLNYVPCDGRSHRVDYGAPLDVSFSLRLPEHIFEVDINVAFLGTTMESIGGATSHVRVSTQLCGKPLAMAINIPSFIPGQEVCFLCLTVQRSDVAEVLCWHYCIARILVELKTSIRPPVLYPATLKFNGDLVDCVDVAMHADSNQNNPPGYFFHEARQ